MQAEALIPVGLLAAVLLVSPAVLVLDRRERRINAQIDRLAGRGDAGVALQAQSIRRERLRFGSLRSLGKAALCYDPAIKDAYRLPLFVVVLISLVAGLAAGLLASILLPQPVAAVVACVVVALTLRAVFAWQRQRYVETLRRQLPDSLQFAVSALRAGFPIAEAVRGIAREAPEPTRSQFAAVVTELSLGRSLQDALLDLYHRTKIAENAILAVTIGVQTSTGGQLAETVQSLAETIRQRVTLAARAKALAGEGVVSATILSILPIVCGIAVSLIRPGYLAPLLDDPRGRRLFVGGVCALFAGILTMRHMIRSVVRE
ncbi:MAG TPA: type II secretion system F family protein [Rhodopila sp.]|nr:type II secretion system F family protein [Rhodopila sp.]